MSRLEVNISKEGQITTISEDIAENSIASLLKALQKAKTESNEALTTLVEKDKLKEGERYRQDIKRKSCEALEGNSDAKRSAEIDDGEDEDEEALDEQDDT